MTTSILSAQPLKTTIGFVNLGCSKNQVDGEVMLGSLSKSGFELTADPEHA